MFTHFVEDVVDGTQTDGAAFLRPADLPQWQTTHPNTYLVAAYAKPAPNMKDDRDANAFDFHYVRQDSNGRWSHKPETTEVTIFDYEGKPIVDPLQAHMKPYRFVGFFAVPREGLDVGANGVRQ